MPINPVHTWFRPKRIGFGWSPATREGWVVVALAALIIGLAAAVLN